MEYNEGMLGTDGELGVKLYRNIDRYLVGGEGAAGRLIGQINRGHEGKVRVNGYLKSAHVCQLKTTIFKISTLHIDTIYFSQSSLKCTTIKDP